MVPDLSHVISELNNEQNFRARLKAISKLGWHTSPESLDVLLIALRDPYFRVREKAAQALSRIYDPKTTEPLIAAVTDIPSVRDAALEALKARILPEDIQIRISKLLDTYSFYERRKSIRGEAPFIHQNSSIPLSEAANSQDFLIREAAVEALGQMHDELAFNTLIKACDDLYLCVRETAIRSLRSFQGPLTVPLLTKALRTMNWVLFDALVDLMFERNYERSAEVLISLLQDESFVIRRRARASLSRIPDDPNLASLVGSLSIWDSVNKHIPAYIIAQFHKEGLIDHAHYFSHAMLGLMGNIVERDWPAGIEALHRLADLNEWRHLAFFCTAELDRRNQYDVSSVLDRTHNIQRKYARDYLCTQHLARFKMINYEGNRYLGCRVCMQTHTSTKASQLVLVIDSAMKAPFLEQSNSFRFNWLHNRARMDFDAIEIGSCSEDSITEFCIDIGNDTDSSRIQGYKSARCYLQPDITLSTKTMNLLRNQFKQIFPL